MTDPISDMLIRLKNGARARKLSVLVPASRMKAEIATVLEREGFLTAAGKKGKKAKKYLDLALAYREDKKPVLREVKRVSKPSRRVYAGVHDLRWSRYGITVLSTPRGIMTDREARKLKVGGELLFRIY